MHCVQIVIVFQDVTTSFWNAATVPLIPAPPPLTMFTHPIIPPASSLPSAFSPSRPCNAAPSLFIQELKEDLTKMMGTGHSGLRQRM